MKIALFFPLQVSLCTVGYLYASSGITQAQITSDETVNTQVNQDGNSAVITGGETRGGNLFHSFQDFSVPTGNEAFFNNANDISNIFSRVTGGNISNIDGLIRANGSASLFLINPAGIIFGENARLDLGGSFYGSTASSILFEDGEFSAADLENPPLLTVNAPIGLGFRDNPGDITVRGNGQGTRGSRGSNELIDTEDSLRVDSDDTFALAGGNLLFEGATIKTAGGRIELGSVEGNEQVNLIAVDEGFSLDYEGVQNFQDIYLSQTATIDSSGEGAGNLRIVGRNIRLTDGSTIENSTLGSLPGRTFDITAADTIEILGSGALSSGLFAQVKSSASGKGGNLSITANNLEIKNGGVINTSTFGIGDGGDLSIVSDSIEVKDNVDVEGDFTAILTQVDVDVEGNGGSLTFDSENINFQGQDVFISVSTFGGGDSGNLRISTDNLSVSNGANLQAITFSDGNAGNLLIEASDFVQIRGFSGTVVDSFNTVEGVTGGIFASAIGGGSGNGGNISIFTNNLVVEEFGTISVSNFQTTGSLDPGLGNVGNIGIEANNITLDNGDITSASNANLSGGNVILETSEDIFLRNNSLISVQAFKEAGGGNLSIDSRFVVAFPSDGTGSDLVANADAGNAGQIFLNAEQTFGLDVGTAIDSDNNFLENNTNDIDASSNEGIGGNISINIFNVVDPLQGVTELPQNVDLPEQTSQQACKANREVAAKNGFTINGKGGIVPDPALPLNSLNITVNGDNNSTSTIPAPIETAQGKIQPARGVKATESGKVILTAYRTNNSGDRIPESSRNCG